MSETADGYSEALSEMDFRKLSAGIFEMIVIPFLALVVAT